MERVHLVKRRYDAKRASKEVKGVLGAKKKTVAVAKTGGGSVPFEAVLFLVAVIIALVAERMYPMFGKYYDVEE
jgi:hypothetical protein